MAFFKLEKKKKKQNDHAQMIPAVNVHGKAVLIDQVSHKSHWYAPQVQPWQEDNLVVSPVP